ncbi:hypothetical protein PR048_027206 [Dryococelus australis]|uniref:Uncharacterized protein n=1 Tax=Dryococelus australis TaxID=614101 RepID=A0ABQ9GES8_9NEOP|nr:hypothetical protein PR048_027206 [Dryococelus australis]
MAAQSRSTFYVRTRTYNPFTVTSHCSEALLKFYFQDIPPPREKVPSKDNAPNSIACGRREAVGEVRGRRNFEFVQLSSRSIDCVYKKHLCGVVTMKLYAFNVKLRKLNTISAHARQKVKSKYRNPIRLKRESQNQSSDIHKPPYDRVKRCRGSERTIKASERVFTQNKRPSRGGVAVRIFAPPPHPGELGSISRWGRPPPPNLRTWGSCRTMSLVGVFSRGSPVSPASFIPAPLLASGVKTSMLRAVQISPLCINLVVVKLSLQSAIKTTGVVSRLSALLLRNSGQPTVERTSKQLPVDMSTRPGKESVVGECVRVEMKGGSVGFLAGPSRVRLVIGLQSNALPACRGGSILRAPPATQLVLTTGLDVGRVFVCVGMKDGSCASRRAVCQLALGAARAEVGYRGVPVVRRRPTSRARHTRLPDFPPRRVSVVIVFARDVDGKHCRCMLLVAVGRVPIQRRAFIGADLFPEAWRGSNFPLDSTVQCTLKPQVYVHWLLPQRVASVTPYLAEWHSLLVSLQAFSNREMSGTLLYGFAECNAVTMGRVYAERAGWWVVLDQSPGLHVPLISIQFIITCGDISTSLFTQNSATGIVMPHNHVRQCCQQIRGTPCESRVRQVGRMDDGWEGQRYISAGRRCLSSLGGAVCRQRDGRVPSSQLRTPPTRPSHESREPGSIPARVTPDFSRVGIVPDDAIGRQAFSGISRFPRPFIPAPLTSITLIGSQDLTVKSRPNLFIHLLLIIPICEEASGKLEVAVNGVEPSRAEPSRLHQAEVAKCCSRRNDGPVFAIKVAGA